MITRRDLFVALISVTTALSGAAVLRSQQPVLGSRLFEWSSLAERTTAVGSVRSVVQAPTATLDELEMHVTTLKPGLASHAAHQHPDEELLIVKEGTVEVLVNGETRRAETGSIIFQASNQLHSIRNVGEGMASYHVIRWISPGMKSKAAK